MKGRKCLLLLAACLVGFGLVGNVDAASIDVLEITSPDSGAVKGIDGTFLVTAKVIDFSPVDSLEIIMYLRTETADSIVVADTLNQSVEWGGLAQHTVVLIAQGKDTPAPGDVSPTAGRPFLKDGEDSKLIGTSGNESLIAVQQKRGRGLASKTSHLGDADSVVVTEGTGAAEHDSTTFKWYGRIPASAGTVEKVRVAAFVIDDPNATSAGAFSGTDIDTSAIKDSGRPVQFKVDADRPAGPDELSNAGDLAAGGTDNAIYNATSVAGFDGSSRLVLGIGDSIVVRSKLGSAVVNGVLLGDSLSVQLDVHSKAFTFDKGKRAADTLRINVTLTEGLFSDLNETVGDMSVPDTLGVFVVDAAGNRSGSSIPADQLDGPAWGVTTGISFLFDTTKPTMDGHATADTILPVSTDTITDGSINTGVMTGQISDYDQDVNPMTFKLAEALDTLFIAFDGSKDVTLKAHASSPSVDDASLKKGVERIVDFTQYGNAGDVDSDSFFVAETSGANAVGMERTTASQAVATGDTLLETGMYTIKFSGQDLAGNKGPELSRTNVYIDVADIDLVRLFPKKSAFGSVTEARTDTIEEETAKVIFKLSEPADSVLITYEGLTGADEGKSRTKRLSGSLLTNTASEQTFQIDSLAQGTDYVLTVLARDLAGNFTRSAPDTFLYDTTFVVPTITRFVITSTEEGILKTDDDNNHIVAGTKATLTLTADATTDGSRDAVTYKSEAILKVAGGSGVTLTGTGVTDATGGRAILNADDWVTGTREVTLKDTVSIDTLTVTIVDSTTSGGPFTGALDSLIVYDPEVFSQILVSAPATVNQGEEFWVGLTLADKFKNTRELDNRYVSISTNKLGVEIPTGDLLIKKGVGGFWANASGWSGDDLVFAAKDIITKESEGSYSDIAAADTGDDFIDGESDSVVVVAAGAVALDAPDTLVAEDYMGADGAGDQGGFVLLTFDLSGDHGTVDAYRIFREVQVNYRVATEADTTDDAIVALEEPENDWMPWGKMDAVPGEEIGRVVVATLDNVATRWAIAAERDGATTAKEAFTAAESVTTPYELMARTMVESKKAADTPVFATLTPEAFDFIAKGVAPRMKSVDAQVLRSALTATLEPVRAIDNIPPEPVPYLRAMDTPNDAGASITVLWTKSESDRLLPRSVSNAVGSGPIADQVAGVKGYNVYRQVGSGELTLVGTSGSGETSFVDVTAFNGVRYTYKVSPYDEDNITDSDLERTAMAIRNNVVDKDGKPVYGLFGMDNRVGFDDFFVFADNFGLTAGDEVFEPAFDLDPNAKIDFDDFFVFADNFGRSIEAAGKVVPTMAGLNTDARLYLDASAELPRVGEEMVIDVSLADFAELKGYGFSVNYEADKLEFVKAAAESSLLGEGELAQPQVITQTDGEVSIAAYGETVTEGELGMSLVFRTKTEIEESYVEVTESEVRDGNYAVNQIALPAPVQIQTRPEAFALKDNYPNPFNPTTTIKYALPEAVDVKLEVFNVVGQVVRTLVDGHQNTGRYVVQWDASDDSGHSLSSGIYFYRLQAGDEFLEVKKMLLLK